LFSLHKDRTEAGPFTKESNEQAFAAVPVV